MSHFFFILCKCFLDTDTILLQKILSTCCSVATCYSKLFVGQQLKQKSPINKNSSSEHILQKMFANVKKTDNNLIWTNLNTLYKSIVSSLLKKNIFPGFLKLKNAACEQIF